jgi:hypothetical protein
VRPDGGGRPGVSVACAKSCTGGTEVCGSDTDCGKNEQCVPAAGGIRTCERTPPPRPDGGGPPGNRDGG